MPFEYLAKALRGGGKPRLEQLEERLRRLENKLSRRMVSPRSKERGSGEKERSRTKRSAKARSVYTSDGWKIPDSQNELRVKDFGRDWVIEFECPNCGAVSREGVNHWHTKRENGHTKYGVYLDCKSCGWRSDLLNIRAFR